MSDERAPGDLGHAGTSARRADGVAKVTGAARYTVDLALPGMAHAVAVRSSRPHAKIVGIDRDAASASPGVLRVITGADLLDAGLTPYYGHVVLDHPVLAIERVRFHKPVPLAQGFARIERHITEAGRPMTAFCACELRSPKPFSFAELLARLTAERERRYVSAYDLAAVHAGLGDREQALAQLSTAVTEGAAHIIHLAWDPRFTPLHGDRRYGRLIRTLGL